MIQEMGSSITAFSYDAARGWLHQLQTISTLPSDYKGSSTCAEVEIHPYGKFLYGSNRGHDSIAVFAIDPVKGTLTPIEYVSTQGKTPRGFGMDPTGHYLIAANQDSNTLVVFRVDATTGRLTPTGQKEDVGSPVCVIFEPVRVIGSSGHRVIWPSGDLVICRFMQGAGRAASASIFLREKLLCGTSLIRRGRFYP